LSIQRADTVSDMPKPAVVAPANDVLPLPAVAAAASAKNYEECLSCQ
jgi:hypothetical protein